jgi:diguanylate cyclase (GGDEF)-like protein/PAS domain S-box-containing protein
MRKDLSWKEAHRWHRRRGHRAIAGAVAALLIGATLSWAFAIRWREARLEAVEARFYGIVATQPERVEQTVHRYVRALEVTRGYFAATDEVEKDDFEVFSRSLDLGQDFPALTALQFIAAGRDELVYPVTFVAPATAAPGLLGKDLVGDEAARAAIESVGSSGSLAMSPPEMDPWQRPRMLLVAPVHKDRRFIGWVGASIEPGRFAGEILSGLPEGMTASVSWGTSGPELAAVGAEGGAFSALRHQESVNVSGTTWSVTLVAVAAFAEGAERFPWIVFGLGLLPAMLTAFVLFFLGRSRMRALILAERLARDLSASEERARAVMTHAVEAILTADGAGSIETANPAAETLFGWTEGELVGRKLAVILPGLELGGGGDLADFAWGQAERMLNGHRKDGTVVPIDVSLAPTSVDERPMYILIARDATLRKLYEDQLTHQATHDPLTSLANRKLFEELLVRAVYRGDRSRSPVAVLYVDLDGFKEINDAFGHQAGDRVLAETARRLESVVRPGDVVARLGGDEFAVLCENLTNVADAEKIASRIVEVVVRGIPVASGVAAVSASVGVAVATSGEGAASVVERADQAMYEMKHSGKAGYRLAGSPTS